MSTNEETHKGSVPEPANESSFVLFAIMAKQAEMAERLYGAFTKQRQAILREYADDPVIQVAIWRMKATEDAAGDLAKALKVGAGRGRARQHGLRHYCPDPRIAAFADETQGLGDACYYFLGLLPKWIAEFDTVGKLWAYCGLHVVNGEAPRRTKGRRANWSGFLKAIAIKRLAEPCMKNRRSPYRAVYELRRTHTTDRDWPDWRSHKDGMRITAKAILKDLWRVSRGHEPLYGGVDQKKTDTQLVLEHPSVAA